VASVHASILERSAERPVLKLRTLRCHPGRSREAAKSRDLLVAGGESRSRMTPLRGSPG
jgi:hypothetical protein